MRFKKIIAFSSEEDGIGLLEEFIHAVVLVGEAPVEFTVWAFYEAIERGCELKNEFAHGNIFLRRKGWWVTTVWQLGGGFFEKKDRKIAEACCY